MEILELSKECLNCKLKPCKNGCPLGNDIPSFIEKINNNEYEQAYKILSKTTILESICGRVCPHYSQCRGNCVKGIKGTPVNIGELESFIGDLAIKNNYEMDDNLYNNSNIKDKKKIAIIGSGPAGLTCAGFLARKGFSVTIFDKHEKLGGILRYGIPEFRLSKQVLDECINKILNLGIKVECNKKLGVDINLNDLIKEFDCVFIAIGANIPWKMGIKGEELDGVFGGNSLLEYNKHPNYTGKNVAIIGGGNVAMDCARTINKMGAKSVTVIYRRAQEQMPAEKKEIEDAKQEGVEFLFQTNIINILGKNKVEQIECLKTKLVKKEGDNRLAPVDIENSNFKMDMDYVIMAIGSTVEETVVNNLGLECDKKGYIQVNENYETSIKGVYAGGDVAGGKATVAWAARSGRDVAEIICNKFENEKLQFTNRKK